MKKKFLNFFMIGALAMAGSVGMVSCSDYDDDINNLQEQITANADAIKKLQDLVGDGKFVGLSTVITSPSVLYTL